MSLQGTNRFDRVDGDFFSGRQGGFFGGLVSSFEFAVDGDEGVLVEAGITLEARFGGFMEAEDVEIMAEKAQTVFKSGHRAVVLKGVGLALGEFDEGAVVLAGLGPCLGEMVGVELEKAVVFRRAADDDVLAVAAAFGDGIQSAREGFDVFDRNEIAYATCGDDRTRRRRDVGGNQAFQTGNYLRFQVPRHTL